MIQTVLHITHHAEKRPALDEINSSLGGLAMPLPFRARSLKGIGTGSTSVTTICDEGILRPALMHISKLSVQIHILDLQWVNRQARFECRLDRGKSR